MASDLLNAVGTIKELEEGFRQQEHLQETLAELDEQIAHARQLVEETQQSQHEVEEQHRATRPQLEIRLQRLQSLSEKLTALQQAQEKYNRRAGQRQEAEDNAGQLEKTRQELAESEKELALVENEAQQVQAKAEADEKQWRQLSVRRQLQQWQRLKEMAEGIAEAQQHVEMADQQRARLNAELLDTKRLASRQLLMIAGGGALALLCLVVVLIELHHSSLVAAIAGIAALALLGVSGANLQGYNKTRQKESELDQQLQEAINRVGMMVAARETAMRMNSNPQALEQIEHEIRSLGSNVPRSIEEAQFILQQLPDGGESLNDAQQQMTRSREQAVAAREQLNVTMEAVAALRKEKARLQDLRKQEGWDDLEGNLRADARRVEIAQKEIVLAAAQEGLPVPDYGVKPASSAPADVELRTKLAEGIRATELELASLAEKVENIPQISTRIQMHQEALDALLARRQSLKEKDERFQANNPMRQIERAREQQIALRDALRSLQDSLRQRVQPLGVSFGQATISMAATTARKQLEALRAALDGKEGLQNRYASRSTMLQENQAALSDHYRKLARFSGSLGSWIVPPNPFADALRALRERCEREIQEADGRGIQLEMDALRVQEGACNAKIELCRHEIEEVSERIATMLAQRNRPPARSNTELDIAAVWPLVREYSPQDRPRLQEEIAVVEQELRELERQDLALSEQLGTGRNTLDLEQTRNTYGAAGTQLPDQRARRFAHCGNL